jgi:hypothetical protein
MEIAHGHRKSRAARSRARVDARHHAEHAAHARRSLYRRVAAFNQQFVDSNEIRSDRMLGDPIKTMASSQGAINIELNYPVDLRRNPNSALGVLQSTWTNAPARQ